MRAANFNLYISLALCTLVVSFLSCPPLKAQENFASGRLTNRTPFDHKLSDSLKLIPQRVEQKLTSTPKALQRCFRQAVRLRYRPDAGKDHWQSSAETEQRQAGDCEDKAIWLYSRLRENGFENIRLVVGKYREIEKSYHVWIWYDDGKTVQILDPSKQKNIWQQDSIDSGFYIPYFSYDENEKYRHKSKKPLRNPRI